MLRVLVLLLLVIPWNPSIAETVKPNILIDATEPPVLPAHIIAVGIPGAGAVAPVGSFHPGGPIRDKPAFATFTENGHVLDPKRILVAGSSNFGAPRALKDQPEGSILSLDPEGATIVVPREFAAAGGQATAQKGRVALFTAQSPAFLNSVHTPGAISAMFPTVSNPLSISINNGFGRLWFANAPNGASGIGAESIADASGEPLADAPSKLAGGVFAGALTGRPRQIVPGSLAVGAVANALLGMSPDGSKRAVFAVLTADGSLVQAHTERNVDGLAPAGTVSALPILASADDHALVTRAGMAFNWVPDRILYVTDPVKNAIVALKLDTGDDVFRLSEIRTILRPEFATPVDITPVISEVASPAFSSNTTLAGGSDLYVANRGNGTLVRMRQDGTVVAVRRIGLPDGSVLGGTRLNGITVSPDAQRIFVTVSGALPGFEDAPGAVIEVAAFGPRHSAAAAPASSIVRPMAAADVARGETFFRLEFSPEQGLGPLYNARSCIECHQSPRAGGMGRDGLAVVNRVGRIDGRTFDPLVGSGGPVARAHSIHEIGAACPLAAGLPIAANLISIRNAPPLFGLGAIDRISDAVIRAGATRNRAIAGRPQIVTDANGRERVGRYGWKADVAELNQFVAEAFRNELGITSALAPHDLIELHSDCGTERLKDDGSLVGSVTAYVASLAPPPGRREGDSVGEALFAHAGCEECHTPILDNVPLHSDLLLHDMGPTLDDGVVQGAARGRDWRTTPLWGLSMRKRFLHDGRANNVRQAILAHDGEGAAAATTFRLMPKDDQKRLLVFLATL
jgi:hypothetical protein